jgi:streptogramin lyase
MTTKRLNSLLVVVALILGCSTSWAAQAPYPANATFTTLALTEFGVEGLTGDGTYLYTAGTQTTAGLSCPVYRVKLSDGSQSIVGHIPAPAGVTCGTAGLAFDSNHRLYVAESRTQATVFVLDPDPDAPPTATPYATHVPGANGIAFKGSDLWISDGTTGFGRVWKVSQGGGDCGGSDPRCEEVFRIQPMNNGSALEGLSQGVGRQNQSLQPPPTGPNTQNLVANGLAFNTDGNLLVADTARGALWLVQFDKNGNLTSKLGCDDTFQPDTLCLQNLLRADPRLEGADGIAIDNSGNIWAAANERNAIVFSVYYGTSSSAEVFRNPAVGTDLLRNSGTDNTNNTKILEFPTSPFITGTKLCVAQSDGNRRDNSPNTAGQVSPSVSPRGKISCMDQALSSSGLPLPRP